MNKNAIKKFAIEARKKLIDSVTDKAGMLGITKKSCSKPVTRGTDFEVYQTIAGTEVTLNRRQCEQRRRLVSQIESRGFEAVIEEVAYTWFNRICAIRFMEVNDYLPNRVRVLSSEKEGKMEPDLVTQAPDVDLDLTAPEKEEIINWKMSGTSEDTDKLYCKLFLKQCHQLHDILPGLFEADSDYMELLFGISYTNKDDVIYMLVNPETGIPEADFNVSTLDEEGNPTGQVEIIGWLYQYYNTELKDDTFAKLKKNVKITKERIPAATQLFTPDWIVRYMVENSVGRIWIEHLRAVDPSTDEKATAEKFGWKYYLPEAEQEEAVDVKLAEIRTTYKDLKPTDITCIDPCMGSGHILIAMFDVLMDIYESAGYDKREAAFEIVEHNIHGLDIDQRAYQLAYFAVMMKGRGYNRRFLRGRDGKTEPKVYAIVESNDINRNHLQFFGTHLSEMERNLAVMQIEGLLDTFKDAREYGSILNVDACDWDVLERFVEDLDTIGQISFESVGSEETQEQLRRLVRVAKNLGQIYDAVVTNPPYRGIGDVEAELQDFVKEKYPDSCSDLSTVFMEKCIKLTTKNGYYAMINIPVWMSLASYSNLRKKMLCNEYIVNMLHLGRGMFGSDYGTTAFIVSNTSLNRYKGFYKKFFERQGAVETEEAKQKKFFNGTKDYATVQELYLSLEKGTCVKAKEVKLFPSWMSEKERKVFLDGIPSFKENYISHLLYEQSDEHFLLLKKLGAEEISDGKLRNIITDGKVVSGLSVELIAKIFVYEGRSCFTDEKWVGEVCLPTESGFVSVRDCYTDSSVNGEYCKVLQQLLSDDEWSTLITQFPVFEQIKKYRVKRSSGGTQLKRNSSKKAQLAINKWKTPIQNCMAAETMNGFSVKDVSKKCDEYSLICANANGDTRYVLVIPVAHIGDTIKLSESQYSAAQRIGESYELFVIATEASEAEYIYIKNPYEKVELNRVVKEWEWVCDKYDKEKQIQPVTEVEVVDDYILKNILPDYFNRQQRNFLQDIIMSEDDINYDDKYKISIEQINSISDFYTSRKMIDVINGKIMISMDKKAALKKILGI